MTDIPVDHQITRFLHCITCLAEVRAIVDRTGQEQSPATYQRLEVGFTPIGIQIWCRRHNLNVMHIDFEGTKHPLSQSAHPAP